MSGRRPAIADPETRKLLIDAAMLLSYREDCAIYAGLHPTTLFQTIQRGDEARAVLDAGGELDPDELVFVEFVEAFKKAESKGKVGTIARIVEAATGRKDKKGKYTREPVWQAGAWLLERKFPEQFGRRIGIANAADKPFLVSPALAAMPDDVVRREVTTLLASLAEDDDDPGASAPVAAIAPS